MSSGKCFLPSKIAQCMLLFEKKIITKGLPLRLRTHTKMMAVATPAMRIILDARITITALGDSACLLASGKWYILHELTNNICCRWNSNRLRRYLVIICNSSTFCRVIHITCRYKKMKCWTLPETCGEFCTESVVVNAGLGPASSSSS